MPIFQDAIEGLMKINKTQINELKSITRPIPKLLTLMSGVCIILGAEPKMISNKDTGFKAKACYWSTVLGPKVLADPHLITRMTTIDPRNIELSVMQKLERLLLQDKISKDQIEHACSAAIGFYTWVNAVRNFYYIYKECEPTRDKLILADLQLSSMQERRNDNKIRMMELER